MLSSKVIVAARNPYLSVFRRIDLPTSRPLKYYAARWNVFLDTIPELDYVILDVGCRGEEKYNQLVDVAKHIGLYSEETIPIIKDYAKAWKPVNISDTKFKRDFLLTGELPEGYDWSVFDSAVDWYESLPTNSYI